MEPTPKEIRAQLDSILLSRQFLVSEHLSDFLRFAVEERLAGRAMRSTNVPSGSKAWATPPISIPRPTPWCAFRPGACDVPWTFTTEPRAVGIPFTSEYLAGPTSPPSGPTQTSSNQVNRYLLALPGLRRRENHEPPDAARDDCFEDRREQHMGRVSHVLRERVLNERKETLTRLILAARAS